MNPTDKKFISLFLVFSITMLSVNLYAKERRGVRINIYKTKPIMDGTPWEIPPDISGELIAVKQNSLLLLNSEGKDVSVDIADIEVITVEMKSKALPWAGIGLLAGAGGGVVVGSMAYFIGAPVEVVLTATGLVEERTSWGDIIKETALIGAVVGALLGALVGVGAGADKTFQIEGMTDSEIQKTLKKLRKKARIHNYK